MIETISVLLYPITRHGDFLKLLLKSNHRDVSKTIMWVSDNQNIRKQIAHQRTDTARPSHAKF